MCKKAREPTKAGLLVGGLYTSLWTDVTLQIRIDAFITVTDSVVPSTSSWNIQQLFLLIFHHINKSFIVCFSCCSCNVQRVSTINSNNDKIDMHDSYFKFEFYVQR